MELVEQYFLSYVLVYIFNDNSSCRGVIFGLNAVCHSLFSSLPGYITALLLPPVLLLMFVDFLTWISVCKKSLQFIQ